MGWNETGSSDSPDDDPLDELLARARWPELSAERLARIERRWSELAAERAAAMEPVALPQRRQPERQPLPHRRRRLGWAALAALAACLLAASLIILGGGIDPATTAQPALQPSVDGRARTARSSPLDRVIPEVSPHPSQRSNGTAPSSAGSPSAADSQRRNASTAREAVVPLGRAPNAYQQLVALAHRPRKVSQQEPPRFETALNDALNELLANPEANLDAIAARLMPDRQRHECLLVNWMPQLESSRQAAAVRLLSQIGTGKSLPALRRLSRLPALRRDALHGLARLETPQGLVDLARWETDAALQRGLLAALVRRPGIPVAAMVLNLVRDPAMAPAALQAVSLGPPPDPEPYFVLLDAPLYANRIAAARVLGRIDGQQSSLRLIDMVLSDVHRNEALLALAASSGPEAAAFLSRAGGDLDLMAAVRAAEYRLRSF